ncbi:hypothetical protein COO60DRAFT_1701571 [Scenedesmus sp. NREL 46B-D3]|nr:hypothetical protein COO60DRAFT_1701571 [Scenedesmus sp. NREL 46B-D3]
MQTLTDVLQAASSKFKPPLQADECELQLSNKTIDLRTPFRLLNVPAGSKLEIIKNATATPAAAAAAAAVTAAEPLQAASPQVAAAGGAHAAPSSSPAAAAAVAEPGGSVDPALAALGVKTPVYVFHQRALEAAAAKAPSPMEADPPDEFFELTAEDLQRLQAQAAAKRKADLTFRTRTAREAESAARAAAMGPVRVRLHLPDGTLLQSDFKATDSLSQVQDLLRKVAAPELAAALYLYTTPPKTLLKDAAATLYSLQLVPAAHIHVGLDERRAQAGTATGGSWLRSEVLALTQDTVPEQQQAAEPEQQQDAAGSSSSSTAEAAAAAQRAARLTAAASRQHAGGAAAGGGKMPKWFKK